jgi:hypothetical protein
MTSVLGEVPWYEFGARDLTQAGVVDRPAIDRAIATRAPSYRDVILLHDVGFHHNEIAAIKAALWATQSHNCTWQIRFKTVEQCVPAESPDGVSDFRGT